MKKFKLVAGVASVFVLGLLVGSLGTGLYMKHQLPPPRKDHSKIRAFLLKRFSHELDLTAEQKKAFKLIIDQVGKKLEDHFRKTHSEIGEIIEPGVYQMRKLLSPEQQDKFDKLIERLERHRKERFKHKPPSPPPGH